MALGGTTYVTVGRDGGPDRAIGWPGCPQTDHDPVITVADAGLAIDAAATGLGQATVPALLAEGDIAAGRVRALDEKDGGKTYWLIAPTPQWRQKKVKALVTALAG